MALSASSTQAKDLIRKPEPNRVDSTLRIQRGDLAFFTKAQLVSMEQHALENVNNCLNTNIYSYLDTSGGQSSNLFLNVVRFFNASVN